MSGQGRLSPLGSARERYLRLSGVGVEPRGNEPQVPPGLVDAAEGFELDDAVIYQAWELARCAPGLKSGEQRALLFLAAASLVNLRRGSTRLPLEGDALEKLLKDLGADQSDRRAVRRLIADSLDDKAATGLIGQGDDFAPFVVDAGSLYLQRMRSFELRLVDALRPRLAGAGAQSPGAEAALAEVLASQPPGMKLSAEQQQAILTALREPLAVVSGGPGTGKTSIVVSILRALVRLGVPMERVALAAPTGKAANRMEESIRKALEGLGDRASPIDAELRAHPPEARTLHRLLGYLPSADRFRHHANNPLSEEVVIVDEGSMIDLFLMTSLARAVRPGARLILLGDADQLPSVDAGAVLRDLVPGQGTDDARGRCAVRLTQSYRMDPRDPAGREVFLAAQAIKDGDAEAAVQALAPRASAGELAFQGAERLTLKGSEDREALLETWYRTKIRSLDGFAELVRREYRHLGAAAGASGGFDKADTEALSQLFRHYDRFRVLCMTRGESRGAGAAACNAWLHRAFAEDREVGLAVPLATASFLPGEPVMMQRNDYSRDLFNGDQGLVLRVSEPGEASHHFRAVFPAPGGFRAFALEGLRAHLLHSFAMTVHKSQGSEFEQVLVMLPERDLPLLTREILYTAVTRARRSAVVAGSEAILRQSVERRLERHSGIGERLSR